jgi:hypothetical protein
LPWYSDPFLWFIVAGQDTVVADFYLTIRYPLKNYLVAGDDFSEREGCHLILTQGQSWHDDKFDHFWQHSTEGKIGLPGPR